MRELVDFIPLINLGKLNVTGASEFMTAYTKQQTEQL